MNLEHPDETKVTLLTPEGVQVVNFVKDPNPEPGVVECLLLSGCVMDNESLLVIETTIIIE